jgi:hypothetical protein
MTAINEKLGIPAEIRAEFERRDKAMSGGLKWVLTPATVTGTAATGAWTREVLINLTDAAGAVQDWFTASFANGLSVSDTSSAGTASIASTTLNVVNGKAVVTVTGSAHAWAATETDTLTVAQQTILGQTVAAKTSVETFA